MMQVGETILVEEGEESATASRHRSITGTETVKLFLAFPYDRILGEDAVFEIIAQLVAPFVNRPPDDLTTVHDRLFGLDVGEGLPRRYGNGWLDDGQRISAQVELNGIELFADTLSIGWRGPYEERTVGSQL